MYKKTVIKLLGGLIFLMLSNLASAYTFTGSMAVLASVNAACNITTNSLQFNTYNPLNGVKDAITTVDLNCSPGTKYSIYMSPGKSGNSADRYMVGATYNDKLHYNIYTNSAHTSIWKDKGEAVNPGSDYIKGYVDTAGIVKVNIYGEITAQQKVHEDNYSDSINVTVDYH